MNEMKVIDKLGDRIKQLEITEMVLSDQIEELQKEVARLNGLLEEKTIEIAELRSKTCQCGDEGCKCNHDE